MAVLGGGLKRAKIGGIKLGGRTEPILAVLGGLDSNTNSLAIQRL